MYEFQPARVLVKYKIERDRLCHHLWKLRLLQNILWLLCYKNSCKFIEIKLKQIQIVKQIFILDIEQGDEVVIPKELSQRCLPLSYQFYDPILNIISANISEEMRSHLTLRNRY